MATLLPLIVSSPEPIVISDDESDQKMILIIEDSEDEDDGDGGASNAEAVSTTLLLLLVAPMTAVTMTPIATATSTITPTTMTMATTKMVTALPRPHLLGGGAYNSWHSKDNSWLLEANGNLRKSYGHPHTFIGAPGGVYERRAVDPLWRAQIMHHHPQEEIFEKKFSEMCMDEHKLKYCKPGTRKEINSSNAAKRRGPTSWNKLVPNLRKSGSSPRTIR